MKAGVLQFRYAPVLEDARLTRARHDVQLVAIKDTERHGYNLSQKGFLLQETACSGTPEKDQEDGLCFTLFQRGCVDSS